jgi:SAM-dependent MidA family methyltransferase
MKFQQLNINDSNPELCNLICERIAASPQQRITFAEYMNLVLYHPQHGYYNIDRPNIGKQGDFITSSDWGADFADLSILRS